ncbi:hypothetical protein ACFQZE_08395 [Paenibacillus sp. GCM10027627]|uniref:hypothetical protein n=1 Tax=unclassified Paenibacillus TaxID=185978 RepID=UPI0036456D88
MALAVFLILVGLGIMALGYSRRKMEKSSRKSLMLIAVASFLIGCMGMAVELDRGTTDNAQEIAAPEATQKPKGTPKETTKDLPTPTPTTEPTLKELGLDGLKDLPEYTVNTYKENDKMPTANGEMNCTSKTCYQVIFDVQVDTPEEKALDEKLDTIQPLGDHEVSTYEVGFWAKDNKRLLDATFR